MEKTIKATYLRAFVAACATLFLISLILTATASQKGANNLTNYISAYSAFISGIWICFTVFIVLKLRSKRIHVEGSTKTLERVYEA